MEERRWKLDREEKWKDGKIDEKWTSRWVKGGGGRKVRRRGKKEVGDGRSGRKSVSRRWDAVGGGAKTERVEKTPLAVSFSFY